MSAVFHPWPGLAGDIRDQREIERAAFSAKNAEFAQFANEARNDPRRTHASVNYLCQAIDSEKAQLFADDVACLVQAVRAKLLESGNRQLGWVDSVLDELGSVIRTCMDEVEMERSEG